LEPTAPYRRFPSAGWERFCVYNNPNGSAHILVVAGGGGYIFADGLEDLEAAGWACALFNAAIGAPQDD